MSVMLTVTLALHPQDRPQLVQAQGLIESGLNIYARGKAKERGAWQIQEKFWGKVPKDMRGQLDQHITIMQGLMAEKKGNIQQVITSYNGKGKIARAYYCKVRKKTIEIGILGV
jgi:hypothetical protein